MEVILAILLCVIMEGFFSGSEIAIVSLPKVELQKRLQKGDKAAKLLEKLLREPEKLLTTTLIGTNISTVTGSALFTSAFLEQIQKAIPLVKDYPELATVLCFTPITLTFGELIPKSLFQKYADKIAFKIVYPIYFFYILFKPISIFVMGISRLVAKLLKAESNQNPFVTKEELKMLVESASKLKVERAERNILKNVLKLHEKTVGNIYVPLLNVIAVEKDSPSSQALKLFEKSGFSKLPVYEDRFDNIVGYITISDFLNVTDIKTPVEKIAKPILVLPEYMNIFDALKTFRKNKGEMAIVVDEYGSTLGIITLKDILEEIVGKIEDEFDRQETEIIKRGNSLTVEGKTEIEEINKLLKNPLPTSRDYITIAGLILSKLGRFPKIGEKLELNNHIIEVTKTTNRKIEEVKIKEK